MRHRAYKTADLIRDHDRCRIASTVLAVLVTLVLAAGQTVRGSDWPQLQHDAAHTGYTTDQPEPPFRLLWHRDLKEPTATVSQVIVAEGKVFVTTGYGNLHALDRQTGNMAWTYKTSRPILSSAAYAEGRVYVNSMDHCCHAIEAGSGQGLWRFRTAEGIWAAPVIAEGKVLVAGRDGFVYAIDPEKGTPIWRAPIGGLVMNTPAYAAGKLYVAAGDMRVYAFDAKDGRQLWRSAQIPGAAIREYWLAASHGTVMLTTQLVYACHPTQKMIQDAVMDPYSQAHKDDPVLRDHETFGALQEWLTSHPHHKTLLVLDAKTGREKRVAPIITVNGGSCIGPMPAVAPDGWAYTTYANIRLRASGWAFFGRYNLRTGEMEPLITDRYAPKLQHPKQWHWQPKTGTTFGRTSTWDGGFSVIDQSWGVSLGGDMAFPVRDPGWSGNPPFYNYYKISTRQDSYLLPDWNSQRQLLSELNLGTVGGGAMHNTCSPLAISDNCLFHKSSRSVVFAFAGTNCDGPEAESRAPRTEGRKPRAKAVAAGRSAPSVSGTADAEGQSWLVDLDDGWPVLTRLRKHLPLDAYRGTRDVIFTVSLAPSSDAKPEVDRLGGTCVRARYRLASGTATTTVNRLSPAVLFETSSDTVCLQGSVLPKYVGFVEDGMFRVHPISQRGDLTALTLDEPWILAWFGEDTPIRAHFFPHDVEDERGADKGPDGFGKTPDPVDLPVLIRLEHTIRSIRVEQGTGLALQFAGRAGKLAVMPLAGGRLLLPQETERWAKDLPKEVLAQCHQWSARLGYFPSAVRESFTADPNAGTVKVQQRFDWTRFEGEWESKAIKAAPVPPMLGLAIGSGLPVTFACAGRTVRPMDYGFMDTGGLAMGIEGVDEYEYTFRGLNALVAAPLPPSLSTDSEAKAVRAKLESRTRQMIEAGHLAPLLYIYGGIGGTWFSHLYWGTGPELAQTVAMVQPYLPESLQTDMIDYLKKEWNAHPPFQFDRNRYLSGRSRAAYELPRSDMERHLRYAVDREADYRASDRLFSLYGVDAYLRLTGDEPDETLRRTVSTLVNEMLEQRDWCILGPSRRRNIKDRHALFYYNLQGAATYNRWLAGAIGAARLAGRYDWQQERARAYYLLATLSAARVAQARYVAQMHRHGLVRGEAGDDNRTLLHIDAGCVVIGRGPLEVGVHQNQEIPPFNDLVEEVGRLLGTYAKEECRTYLDHLDCSLPFWYISEAPKGQATEHRTTPLQYYSGNVLAHCWILDKRRDDFARYIDSTRFLGDLYYLQNLAACLRSYDETQ